MDRRIRIRLWAFALAFSTIVAPRAQPQPARDLAMQRFEIDPMHSTVGFASTILGAVKVRGRFTSYRGTVIYNARQPELSSVSVIIEAASINTDMSFRDDHLRSTDFFAVKQFPTIEFVSDRVTPTNGGAIVSGTLTMHGVSKRVDLPATLLMSPRLVGTTPNVAFAAVLTLSRKDFGIAGTNQYNPDYNPLTTMLSDSVAVLLELSGNRDSFIGRTWGKGTPPGVADTINRLLQLRGIEAAVGSYRQLRAAHSSSFDLSADQLDGLGRQLAEQGNLSDALALLALPERWFGTSNCVHREGGAALAQCLTRFFLAAISAVEALSLVRSPGEREGVRDGQCDIFVIS